MNDTESESKFDSLSSVVDVAIHNNLLSRIPSLKNCRKLRSLYLSSNRITEIGQDAFRGATQLVMLRLGGNRITSVAQGAFATLTAMQVPAGEFAPNNTDGTPYANTFGIGACLEYLPFSICLCFPFAFVVAHTCAVATLRKVLQLSLRCFCAARAKHQGIVLGRPRRGLTQAIAAPLFCDLSGLDARPVPPRGLRVFWQGPGLEHTAGFVCSQPTGKGERARFVTPENYMPPPLPRFFYWWLAESRNREPHRPLLKHPPKKHPSSPPTGVRVGWADAGRSQLQLVRPRL